MREIRKALDKLPKEFSLTRRRNILKKGLEPFLESARRKSPKRTGDLALSIDTKTFRNNKNFVFGGVTTKKKIKIGGSAGSEVVDGFYAKFLEFGFTHIAWPKKDESISGRPGKPNIPSPNRLTEVEPKPFMRPAWDEKKGAAKKTTIDLVDKRIKAYMKKVNRS